ncbi:MAG: PQQ-binding-like beta-propeller repeat protein, partial [Planctomycetota bacterium]|nr:PQQ-binding-like beta-propeller repeat protein [Planctomycetota bacterium]
RALRDLKADLAPLRVWQQQKADARVDALGSDEGAQEADRLVRRYPWARRVQEMLIEQGEQALREGRADVAAGAFDTAAAHAEDPTLMAQARLGLWLALGQGPGGPEAMEQAMAQAPDGDPMPRRGAPGTAAQAKAFVRNLVGAGQEAQAALPRATRGRIELPAAMTAQSPAWRGGHESWCLGPWAIRRIEPAAGQVLVFGPRNVACYDGATLAPRWHYAAPDALAEPGPVEEADARVSPAWRPLAMAPARSPSVAGHVVYALLARGGNGADLRALDARTGRLIWTTQGRPEWAALQILTEPAAMEDLVYVLAMEQNPEGVCAPYLVCLAGDEPKIVWKRKLATVSLREQPIAMARHACGVALHQGAVYVSTNMGILAKCDARTGSLDWLRTYPAATAAETAAGHARREGSVPLVAGDLVYFAPRDHSGVIALDRQTGRLAWESLLVPSDQIVGLTGRSLVVRDANELAALDAATGEELWTRPVESEGTAPAVISAGHVLLAGGDKLLRFSARTGQEVENLAAPRPIGTEHMLLPGGALVDVAEEPLLERTLAAQAGANPGPLRPPFVKRWTLPCRDPQLVVAPASTPPSDLVGVLAETRFFCVRVRPACRLAWQMAFRERPDSAGFHGRLVVFATGDTLTALDMETGAVRWRRTLPFAADLIAGDDRALVVAHSSPEAPVMALSPETGQTLWYRWFGQEGRFTGRRLRWLALTGEGETPPVLRLYWEAALFAREGPRPAEVLVEPASGAIRDVRLFLPAEPAWPARIYFGGDHRTRSAPEAGTPWPYLGSFRPDALAYIGKDAVARFALREGGADLAAGWNPQADPSPEAARRWAGLFATPAGCYVKRLGQLAFFDAQAKREILFQLPRGGDRENGFAIGDFREAPAEQLTVVSVA